jgi:L,D-transpeptidase catalytic domain
LILKVLTGARSGLILVAALAVFIIGCQDPPLAALDNAKRALDKASRTGALQYSEKTYRAAEKLVQAGWMEMARQNGRLAPFRNYKAADSILKLALATANKATSETENQIKNLDSLAQSERRELQKDLLDWREALNGALARYRLEYLWNQAELAYRTSEKLIFNREYQAARQTVAEGKLSLRKMAAVMDDYINDEAQKIHVWRRWVAETVAASNDQGGHAVIVDKSKHIAYLIQNGKVIHRYDCEFGFNPSHQKLFSGDGATPEGKYTISAVKTNGRSTYYKALLLSYPNANDQARFAENKARGIISRRARIGGLIEIHGEGGRGRDWTEGCVALTNKDMDHLMRYVSVGTPVTIVRRSDKWP